jgi:hypothetical protein
LTVDAPEESPAEENALADQMSNRPIDERLKRDGPAAARYGGGSICFT